MTEKPTESTDKKPDETKELSFKFKSTKKLPKRAYRKGSKYDPIVKQFNAGKDTLVQVLIKAKDDKTYMDGNYVRNQLKKRVEALNLTDKIDISVVNDVCYLEKIIKK